MDNTIHHNVIYAGIQPFREFSYESSAELVHICQRYYHTSRDLLFWRQCSTQCALRASMQYTLSAHQNLKCNYKLDSRYF